MAAEAHAKEQRSICFCVMSKIEEDRFNYFKQLYQNNKFDILFKEKEAIYWLKLRSIARKSLLLEFCKFSGIECSAKESELFKYIYKQKTDQKLLDQFVEKKYQEGRAERRKEEPKLISELYKLQVFDWGGLYQNNLERTIVNNYIKKIRNFTFLAKKIEGEIHESVRSYVLSSWFNHWTSILIEDIFKDHRRVTATVGLIKKIDFFVECVPFDLKVTYFPDGFMQARRKEIKLKTELQELKVFAAKKGIKYDRNQKDKIIFKELLIRIKESVDPETKKFWKQFNHRRQEIIKEAMTQPKKLIRWLYEYQGERRFDAANRLFLILIDEESLEESWKMKRNMDLLKDKINYYLDHLDLKNKQRLKIEFNWLDGQRYSVLSDVVFITKGKLKL